MTCCWPWFKSKSTKREKLHSIIKLTVTSTQGVCLRGKNLIFKTIDSIKKYVLDSAVYYPSRYIIFPEVMKFYTLHRYLEFRLWKCIPWHPIFDRLYFIITLPNTLNGFDTQKAIFLFFYSFLLPYLKYVYVDNR